MKTWRVERHQRGVKPPTPQQIEHCPDGIKCQLSFMEKNYSYKVAKEFLSKMSQLYSMENQM